MTTPRTFDAVAGFDTALLPGLAAIPGFRPPTDAEIDLLAAAYDSGDPARLVDDWRRRAEPTRARLHGVNAALYRSLTLLPRAAIRASFLATVRMVLAASERFFAEQLKPGTAAAIRARLSFVAVRHTHVPPGYTPDFTFPLAFARWVDADDDLEAVLARFQLAAVLNEVQQSAYSHFFADHFGIPEIHHHAEIERALAIDYATRFRPPASRALVRQALLVLDGLNAAVFALVSGDPLRVFGRCLIRPSGWAEFAAAAAAASRGARAAGAGAAASASSPR